MSDFDPQKLAQMRAAAQSPSLADQAGGFDPAMLEQQKTRGTFMNPAIEGAALGWGDEGTAALEAGYKRIAPEFMGGAPEGVTFNDMYQPKLEELEGDRAAFNQRNPNLGPDLESLMGLGTGVKAAAKLVGPLAQKGYSVLNKILRGGSVGAVEGGIAGSGFAPQGSKGEGGAIGAAGGLLFGGGLAGAAQKIGNKLASNKEARMLLGQGTPDSRVATADVVPRSPLSPMRAVSPDKVVTNKPAAEAVRQGTSTRAASIVRNSSPDDIDSMKRMLAAKLDNMRTGRAGATPQKIIGDSMMERYKHLHDVKTKAGQKIDDVVTGIKGDVDGVTPKKNFDDKLGDLGMTIDADGKTTFPPGSDLYGQKGTKIIKDVIAQLEQMDNSPASLQKMKGWLDDIIYGAKDKGKKTGSINKKAEKLLDKLRSDINDSIRKVSPEYRAANDTYSEISNVLKETNRLGGVNFNPNSDLAGVNLGSLSRRMLSNARTASSVEDMVNQLDDGARKYGGKFNDDIRNLNVWSNEMDNILGATPGNTFDSGIQRGAENALRGNLKDAALDAGKSLYNSSRNISQDSKIQALQDFLSAQSGS